MLYKIDYIRRNDPVRASKFVNHAADKTEAVTRFMDWFFRAHPTDSIKPVRVTEIEIVGDMSGIDLIDKLAEEV